ncbi:hypothetical protein [Microbacterium sp. Leaf179]|uniref:hypothetical protein n=1 Tax=Microbacterium sp. Leaf179 TaxID=1736288 RepID=UPI0006FBE847|nr:hypothetical protein [Microbacterium sp. Leaf179]KQR86824.1 hypothetical protein ASF96_10955 [Microbacterium sp. Leaf179]
MPHIILTGHREVNPLLPFLPGFRDDFNRPNGALIATADGRAWKTYTTDSAVRADVVVQDNAAVVTVPADATGNVAKLVDSRATNMVIETVVKVVGSRAGSIYFRATDMLEGVEFCLRTSSGSTRPAFFTRINGARAMPENGQAPVGTVINDGDRIRLVADGTSLIAYLNDVPIIACESSVGLSRTGVGFYAFAGGPGIAFDSLRVYA